MSECIRGTLHIALYKLTYTLLYGNVSTCSSYSLEWVCGMLCHYSLLPWSCRHWWVDCIYSWLSLGYLLAPVVLPLKWPTGYCHQHSEGSWLFILQFVLHLRIHRGSPSSPSPLGCWTSMKTLPISVWGVWLRCRNNVLKTEQVNVTKSPGPDNI